MDYFSPPTDEIDRYAKQLRQAKRIILQLRGRLLCEQKKTQELEDIIHQGCMTVNDSEKKLWKAYEKLLTVMDGCEIIIPPVQKSATENSLSTPITFPLLLQTLGESLGADRVYLIDYGAVESEQIYPLLREEWLSPKTASLRTILPYRKQEHPLWKNSYFWLQNNPFFQGNQSLFPPDSEEIKQLNRLKVISFLILPIIDYQGENCNLDNLKRLESGVILEFNREITFPRKSEVSTIFKSISHLLSNHCYRHRSELQKQILFYKNQENKDLIQFINEIVFKRDIYGKIIFLNQAWTDSTGFSFSDGVDRHYLDFVHPDDRIICQKNDTDLLTKKKTITKLQARYLNKDGSYHWFNISQRLYLSPEGELWGIVGTMSDITTQKVNQDLLKRERKLLRQIINQAPIAIAMFDRNMNYIAHSKQWIIDYKLPYDSLLGLSHFEVFPQLPRERQEIYQKVLTGEFMSSNEDILPLNDGTKIYFRWAMQPWYETDSSVGGMIIVTQSINELVIARESALESARIKSRFLANMSHEIRTPMNGVIGMTDLLLRTPLNPQQRDFVETLKGSGKTLLTLINDILDFSKLEAGEMRIENDDFDLNEVLDELVDILAIQTQGKRLELLTIIDPHVPTNIKGDAGRLRQILMNLTGNSIKFTEEGVVIIYVYLQEETTVNVRLRFEVKDTGIGISTEQENKLFRSFSQVDAETTRKYGGTGLGLAICKQLVELMGGNIGVESELGVGSTFWFTIVFDKQEVLELDSPPLRGLSNIGNLWGKRLLVVDHNPLTRKLIRDYVSAWGMVTDSAHDLQVGLHKLHQGILQQQPFDHLLLEVQQPDLLEDLIPQLQCYQLPDKEGGNPLHIIFLLSQEAHESLKNLMMQNGGCYLFKPLKFSRLLPALMNRSNPLPSGNNALACSITPISLSLDTLKVLVVEDTPVNQKVLLHQLALLNIKADCVNNGYEALAQLQEKSYHIILMDCLLPELDGYETTKLIREQEANGERYTFIIALTANALLGEREKCLAVGMDDYISKPIELEKLAMVLQLWADRINPNLIDSPSIEIAETPFDDHALNDLANGNESFKKELLQVFVEDVGGYLQNLAFAIENRDYKTIHQRAHQIKGASAMLSMTEISNLAHQIEREGEQGYVENAEQLLVELQKHFDRVDRWIKEAQDFSLFSS